MIIYSGFTIFTCFILSTFATSTPGVHRKLFSQVAPGCNLPSDLCNVSVYYVKAVGDNDTIHYLWDFTGKPSLLLAHTQLNVSLEIDWETFLLLDKRNGSLKFSSMPDYYLLFILDKLIEYDDVDDTGMLTKDSKNRTYSTELFNWTSVNLFEQDVVQWEMIGKNFSSRDSMLSGSVHLQISAFGDVDHDPLLPRLLHSGNSSQVRVILNNLFSNSGFNHTRWALEMVLVSTDPRNSTLGIESRKNLDDENSPGVFTIVNVMTPEAEQGTGLGAYLQWRPVVYTDPTPSIANSSDVGIMNPTYVLDPEHALRETLYSALHHPKGQENLVQSTIVTFGEPQDGFYKKNRYSSWAFLVSYGSPQMEGFSMLVILILAIGLGLPVLLVLSGAVFLCVRRFSSREDELSLER